MMDGLCMLAGLVGTIAFPLCLSPCSVDTEPATPDCGLRLETLGLRRRTSESPVRFECARSYRSDLGNFEILHHLACRTGPGGILIRIQD